jgi:hypothetical protein
MAVEGNESGPESFGDLDSDSSVNTSGPVSFDDFDRVDDAVKENVKEKKESKAKAKEANEVKEKKAEIPSQDGDDDEQDQSEELTEKEQKKKDKADELKKEKAIEDKAKQAKESKKIKAKYGEEEIDMDIDTEIPIKVDGEIKYFKVKDLMNHKAGEVAWDKRFSQLDRERKSHESSQGEHNSKMQKFKELIESASSGKSSPMDAMNYFIDSNGIDGHNFYKGLRTSLFENMEDYVLMSDEQRAVHDLTKENEFLTKRQAALNEDFKLKQARSALEGEINQTRKSYGIEGDEFVEAYEMLKKNVSPEFAGKITPKNIAEYAMDLRGIKRSDKVIRAVDEKMVNNQKFFNSVFEIIRENPSFTDQDVVDILAKTLGKRNVRALEDKINSNPEKQSLIKKEKEIESFDDLEDY